MTSVSNLTICSNNLIEIPLTSDISSTYTWQASDNSLIKGESILIKSTDILKDSLKSEAINQETVTYSVKPTSLLGCIGATQTVSVRVNPTPVIQNVLDTICSGLNFNLVPTHQLPIGNIVPLNSSFTWPTPSYLSGTLIGPLEQTTNNKTISQKINNKTNAPIELIYQITPKSGTTGGCTGKPFEYKVLVKPTPEILTYTQDSICSSDSKTYLPKNGLPTSDNIVPSNTKYTWNTPVAIPNGSVDGMIAETVGSNQIDLNLTNPTTQFGRVVYSIIPTSDKCTGKAFEIPVVVKPLPLITNQLTKDFCGENKVNMKLTSSVPSKFTWKAEDNTAVSGETLLETTKDSITDLLSNQTFNSQFVKYILKPESTYGCKGQEKELIIKIYEKIETLVLSTNKTNNTICDGDNITVNAIPLKLKSYDFYDAITNTIVQSTSSEKYTLNTLKTSKSLYVIAKDSNNCFSKKSATLQVTVNPNPVMTSTNNSTICSNNLIEIPLTSDINSTYTWQATDNPSIKGESTLIKSTNTLKDTLKSEVINQETVTYSVKPTSLLGCPGAEQTVTVKVNPTPVIKNVLDTICSGLNFNLVPTHQLPIGNILPLNSTFTWPTPSYPSGTLTGPLEQNLEIKTISQLIKNKTNTSIDLIYLITPTSGAIGNCIGKPFEYKVLVKPTPEISRFLEDSICSGDIKTYLPKNGLPASDNIVPINTKYTWNAPASIPNGSVEGMISETVGVDQIGLNLTNPTTQLGKVVYSILPISDKCVGKPFDIPVIVKPTPLITNQLTKDFCSENRVNINLTTSIPAIISWKAEDNKSIEGEVLSESVQESIQDLLVNKSPITQSVKYILKPTSTNGCKGIEKDLLIQVFPKPSIKNTTIAFCNGDTLQFVPKDGEDGNIVPMNTLFKWNVLEKFPVDSIIGSSNQTTPLNKITQLLKTKTISGNIKYEVFPTSTIGGNCTGSPFNLTVNVHPVPDPKVVISDTGICKGTEISITTTLDETYFPSINYKWNTGQDSKSFALKPQQSTVFKLTATSNGCSSSPDSVSVFVDQTVPNIDAGVGSTICRGDSIELKAVGGKTYSWKYDKSLSKTTIANPKAAPYVTTKYYVTAKNDFCSAEDEVLITIDRCLKELPFKIPQVFTPNQDGANDVWELIDIDYFPKSSITIFNRWGGVVYEKSSYFNEWDGKNMSGDELPDGTYYYVVDLGNGHDLYKGFVVITR
jgi:gliding motility-associated-like protein